MLFKVLFCTLFCCVLSHAPYPNILEVHSCNLALSGRNITFVNSFVQARYEEDLIYFSACKDLMQVGCDRKALVCIKKNNKFINLMEVNETSESFIVRSKESCANQKYQVEIRTSFTLDKYKLEKQGRCKYLLEINPGLTENCTKAAGDRRLFFNYLSKDILIKTDEETIILNLCGPSNDCGDGNLAVCSKNETSKSILPLGHVSTERVNTDGDHIEFHYKTTGTNRKKEKLTSVILKCNWTTLLGNTSLRRASTKKLEITVETSVACVKRTRSCLVIDSDNYLHNLTGLSRADGWKLTDNKNGSNKTIKLNVCGPLESNRLCSDQHSQVCRIDDQPVNYGTAMSKITVENEVVRFSFKDGSQCSKNPRVNLMSTFELHCVFEEEGPKLVKEDDCDIEISWKTPFACPVSDENVVDRKLTKEYDRKPCIVEDGDLMYNLTQLSMKSSNYVVKSNELDFVLGVCKPVLNVNNSFCHSSMGMCVKNNSEPNIKKIYFSIGNVQSPIVQNGQLILKYSRGFFCKKSVKDASAIIYFNCSEEESLVTFLKETDCLYEFNWKTKYACPNKIECVFRDTSGNLINLEDIKGTNFQFKNDGTTYTIDVCRNRFTIDDGLEETRDVKVVKGVFNDKANTFLEYRLDKSCRDDAKDFNVVRIYLDCDVLLNNAHYEFGNISDCTANLKFRHNSFCRTVAIDDVQADVTVRNVEEKVPRNYYDTHENDVRNCIVQYKDEEINLNSFKPVQVTSSKKVQYTIGINRTSCCCHHFICQERKAVATLNKCPKAVPQDDQLKLTFDDLSYLSEIVFYCKTDRGLPEVVLEEHNLVSFRYPLDSLCSQSSGGSGPLIGGIVSCVFVILLCGLGLYNKQFLANKCRRSRKSQVYVYCRNSDD